MTAKRKGQEVPTAQESQENNKVQRQIKALQKRCRELEYDIIYIKMQLPKPHNPVGFKINQNDNE